MTAFRPVACGDVGPAIQELKKPGSEDPLVHHVPGRQQIEYKSARDKAWRAVIIAAVNAGLDQKLFTLRYGDNRFAEKQLFDFTLPNGLPARGWVGDIGFGELSIHVAVKPKGDWVRAANAGFSAGDAFATTWLEREHGAWIQTSTSSFRCRKALLAELAALDVSPSGFGDRGRVIM